VIERQTQIVAESVKIEQLTKIDFFEDILLVKSKSVKLIKFGNNLGLMHKKSQIKKIFRKFSRIFTVQRRNLFHDSNFPKSYLPQIRGSSWHKNEIKMISRGHYSINNFQDSNKKSTKKKILGYLPRVFFFKAFELGAESGNQVISSDEASSS
jgi:hypothetical protein